MLEKKAFESPKARFGFAVDLSSGDKHPFAVPCEKGPMYNSGDAAL
jgi:hypothetical protein